jgi:hypothetical protein
MSSELFSRARRAGLIAIATLASLSLAQPGAAAPAKTAAQPKAKVPTAAAKTKPKATAATKAAAANGKEKPGAKGKAKAKSAKAAEPRPVPVPDIPSEAAGRVLAWIAASRDNASLPYIVIDKQAATLLLFKANGEFVGQTPVLIGVGVGDDSSPGVGAKSLAEIGPAERTTPAGRFASRFGKAFGLKNVLWVDYANSVAVHAVITTNKKERRVERLRSPEPDDNRVTFGCINVGTNFYANKVTPLFRKKGGVVYILPDTRPLEDVFPRVRLLPYLAAEAS